MKLSKPLMAGLGILLLGITPLVQAAPGQPDDQRQGGQQQDRPEQHEQQRNEHGNPQGDGQQRPQQQAREHQNGGRPPQDFAPIRQTIQDHRDSFGHGNPLPPNVRAEKGRPLPHGYGKRLDSRALAQLPRYPGYEWRRLGNDVVLISIGSGIVYEIMSGVLN